MTDSRDGKNKLAEALQRVVAREGIAGVSVRSVAAEAGVSAGSVQYHFRSRAEMIRYAMEQTSATVEARLERRHRWGAVKEWTRNILLDLLPLDSDRRREFSVWLAFVAHASTDPALLDLKQQTNDRLHWLYSRIIRARRGIVIPEDESLEHSLDPENDLEATLLQSLMDGLSLRLADLDTEEAMVLGPKLLDRYLAVSVDACV